MSPRASALIAASLMLATPALAQTRASNMPPPPAVEAGADAQKIGSGFGNVGSAATRVGNVQKYYGNASNAGGNSLLDFSGDGTRGDRGIADGVKNQRLGALIGAGGSAVAAGGNVINAADAYYRGDSAAMLDHSSQALSNVGGTVGAYVPGVGGVSKATGAAGRVVAGAMSGDGYAAAGALAETVAYGASCAAGWLGGGGALGCDKAVDASDLAIEYGNSFVGYGMDKYFEHKDQAILDNSDAAFAALRARHAASAQMHAATNEDDARVAAAQAAAHARAEARAQADYDAQVDFVQSAQYFSAIAGPVRTYSPSSRGGSAPYITPAPPRAVPQPSRNLDGSPWEVPSRNDTACGWSC